MAKPQCPEYQKFESRKTESKQELDYGIEQEYDSHPDDRASMKDNVDSYLKVYMDRCAESSAHIRVCEECQRED
jgi:hypothetical protein